MSCLENFDLDFFAEIAQLKNRLWQKNNIRYEYGIASGGAWALALTRSFGGSSTSCDGGQDFSSTERQLNLVGIDANSLLAEKIVHCSPEWAFKLGQAQINNYAPIALREGARSCIVFVISSHIKISNSLEDISRCCILAMQKDLHANLTISNNSWCEYYKSTHESSLQITRIQHEIITTLLLLQLELRVLLHNCLDPTDMINITTLLDRLTIKLQTSHPIYTRVSPTFKSIEEAIQHRDSRVC